MNTRSGSDKDEIEKTYKAAINQTQKVRTNSTLNPPHTSTPYASTSHTPRSTPNVSAINFSLDDSITDQTLLSNAPESSPNDSAKEKSEPSDITEHLNLDTILNNNNKNETAITMAQHNPFVTLKYAIEAVPFFDGTNTPLNYFIEGCEEAKLMLPNEAESQFVKILRTRIVGEARRTISDKNFETVAELIKYLKQIYGGSKNMYQLQGELGSTYQRDKEDVITYANRVKLLGRQILEAYRSSGHENKDIKTAIETDMCKCFIRGLKPEIEQRLNRNQEVHAAITDALRIEKELRAVADLRHTPVSSSQIKTQESETCQICFRLGHTAANCRKITQLTDSFKPNNQGTEILICQICKKRGHSAEKCRQRDPRTHRSVNIIQENSPICQLCSKFGHNAKNCRLNSSNKNMISLICQWCDKSGHSARNCWKKQNEQFNSDNQAKIICQICSKMGHNAKNCRSNSNQQLNTNDPLFCRYCKDKGHLLENCQLRIASNNRRREYNSGNEAGPSKPGESLGAQQIPRPVSPVNLK